MTVGERSQAVPIEHTMSFYLQPIQHGGKKHLLYADPAMPISALRRLARNPEHFYVQAPSVKISRAHFALGKTYEVSESTTVEEVAA